MKQVLARFIRIHPVSWVGHVCMRVDIRSRGMYITQVSGTIYSKTIRNETLKTSSTEVICILNIL